MRMTKCNNCGRSLFNPRHATILFLAWLGDKLLKLSWYIDYKKENMEEEEHV